MNVKNFVKRKIKQIEDARIRNFEKTLPAGTTYEMFREKMMEEIKVQFLFLKKYIETIFDTQKEIETKIKQIEIKTQQPLEKEQLLKELWIMRYACLCNWFLSLYPPKNQNELGADITLINRVFQWIKDTSNYLPWITEGLTDYNGDNPLEFNNLKEFEKRFSERFSEKMVKIVFDCTGGRLAGEQHDSIMELIMTMITQDKKIFFMENDNTLNGEEIENIKETIKNAAMETKKEAEDFFNSI